jgi:hypothetical protein
MFEIFSHGIQKKILPIVQPNVSTAPEKEQLDSQFSISNTAYETSERENDYDPFRSPPDFAFAKAHGKANRVCNLVKRFQELTP